MDAMDKKAVDLPSYKAEIDEINVALKRETPLCFSQDNKALEVAIEAGD